MDKWLLTNPNIKKEVYKRRKKGQTSKEEYRHCLSIQVWS